MLFHGVCEAVIPLITLVQFDSVIKPPVIGKTSDSGMLKKGASLHVVGVEFVAIGFMNQH